MLDKNLMTDTDAIRNYEFERTMAPACETVIVNVSGPVGTVFPVLSNQQTLVNCKVCLGNIAQPRAIVE